MRHELRLLSRVHETEVKNTFSFVAWLDENRLVYIGFDVGWVKLG